MPRISAPSIAEHVARQEASIIEAAAQLFADRGVAGTDIGDIAQAVGLARSSLYRYFPDKQHILIRWFELELVPIMERSREILDGDAPVDDRLVAWLDYQLDEMATPEHDVLLRLGEEAAASSAEVRTAIAQGHLAMYRTLGAVMDEALEAHRRKGAKRRDPVVVTSLIAGLVGAAGRAILDGADAHAVRAEAHRSLRAVLDA
jgi:AcrR family transcriptional regulator